MDAAQAKQTLAQFQHAVEARDHNSAGQLLEKLKGVLLELDSLPPLSLETPAANEERLFARQVFEYAVLFAAQSDDKEGFQRYMSQLRTFYTDFGPEISESPLKYPLLGLNLLFLLVDHRLAEFHSELELLTEEERNNQYISYSVEIDRYLMTGSYDQVLAASQQPPHELYRMFTSLLMESVREQIAECAEASYKTLKLSSAAQLFLFNDEQDAAKYIRERHPEWQIENGVVHVKTVVHSKAESIPSFRLISETLSYATELDRIV